MRVRKVLGLALLPVILAGTEAGAMTPEQMARCLGVGANMSTCSPPRGARPGPVAMEPPARQPGANVSGSRSAAESPRAAPPSAIAPQAEAAPARPGADGLSLTVQFGNGSAVLTPAGTDVLDRLGKALQMPELTSYRYRIEGHTDTVGNRDGNRVLSVRRAETVVGYLQTRFGIRPERLQSAGLGQDELLIQTADNVPEPRNRRVQIVNLGR